MHKFFASYLDGEAFGVSVDDVIASGAFAGWTVGQVLTFAAICLFIGACGKSAQIPLFVWLPDAMAGPTPVSALIHAATMVTAGVYLTARLWPLYTLAPVAGAAIAVIGGLTALVAAFIALAQRDIKKVLAYSTISQLGYMFIGIGVGAYGAAIFHLVTHAFFKALLFLGAGAVIHALGGHQGSKQDMVSDMGGLRKPMRFTFWVMLIASLAIAGIPPLSGAISKDEILLHALLAGQAGNTAALIAFACGLTAAAMTAFYMFRLLSLTFLGAYRGDEAGIEHARHHPPGWIVWAPLAVLALLSVVGGALNWPHGMGGRASLTAYLNLGLPRAGAGEHAGMEIGLTAGLAVLAAVIGLATWALYTRRPEVPRSFVASGAGGALRAASAGGLGIDWLYNRCIARPLVALADWLWVLIEGVLIEGLLALLSLLTRGVAALLRRVQTGQLSSYATLIAAGAILMLAYLLRVWEMFP